MQFSTLMVYVEDMTRAVSFYRDAMGLQCEVESPGWSQFALSGGASLGLHVARGPVKRDGGFVPGFAVEDIRVARERLTAAGAKVMQDYHDIPGGVVLELADPEGNTIDISQMGTSCSDLGVRSD